MKRYRIEVVRTDEYIIEIDENVINDQWKKEFEESFWKVRNLQELAEHLAEIQATEGSYTGLIEGFGHITRNGVLPFSNEDYDEKGALLPPEKQRKPEPGFNIIILSEGGDAETYTELLK